MPHPSPSFGNGCYYQGDDIAEHESDIHRADRSFYLFCHHEPAAADEGSAFLTTQNPSMSLSPKGDICVSRGRKPAVVVAIEFRAGLGGDTVLPGVASMSRK